MDINPKSFPILSYIMNQGKASSSGAGAGAGKWGSPSGGDQVQIVIQDPKVLSAMTAAVNEVVQTRAVLENLGPRPDHEAVDLSRAMLAKIEAETAKKLEELVTKPRPVNVDRMEWRSHLAEKEKEIRAAADKEKGKFKAVVTLEEMHEDYLRLLRDAETRLEKMYEAGDKLEEIPLKEETNEEVINVLQEASRQALERIDLPGRRLRFLPEAFGKISSLVALNVSSNQLRVIPDSIAGLVNLQELNVSSNLLESLPDSVGLLNNLKILNVSGNKLSALPNSICNCRSLVELDVSFNNLTYLPTNIGVELENLQKLCVQLNKIRSLPTSVGEMRSLRHLDVHFNELHGLPHTIGNLTNLEFLDLSSNFTDMKELPDTIGELTNLRELYLSNNQIRALPDTFGRLEKLTKVDLDLNPIEIPPMEVVKRGIEAIKIYMAKRWLDMLMEEEAKSQQEVQEQPQQTGWLTRSATWLRGYVADVTDRLGNVGKSEEPYLNEQL